MTAPSFQGSCDISVVSFQAWMGTLCCCPLLLCRPRGPTHTPVKPCPWRLGCWDTPEPPCCTHGYWTHACAYKHTHTHTAESSCIWTNKHTCIRLCIHRITHNWSSHSLTHSHTQSPDFIRNTSHSPHVSWGYVQWVGQLQNSERVKFHISLGGEGEGTECWLRCTQSHMETGFRGKLPVTRSSASISCSFSVSERLEEQILSCCSAEMRKRQQFVKDILYSRTEAVDLLVSQLMVTIGIID